MMRLRHYYRWLTSRDYRLHYWLGKNLSGYKIFWGMTSIKLNLLLLFEGIERLESMRSQLPENRRNSRLRKILDEVIAQIRGAE